MTFFVNDKTLNVFKQKYFLGTGLRFMCKITIHENLWQLSEIFWISRFSRYLEYLYDSYRFFLGFALFMLLKVFICHFFVKVKLGPSGLVINAEPLDHEGTL